MSEDFLTKSDRIEHFKYVLEQRLIQLRGCRYEAEHLGLRDAALQILLCARKLRNIIRDLDFQIKSVDSQKSGS